MKEPWRYWRWVRLTMQGQRQVEELLPCREFLQESVQPDSSDVAVQQQLVEKMRVAPASAPPAPSPQPAEGCLRCFISQEIDRTCRDLHTRFGRRAGISAVEDLLLFVLTDADPLRQRPKTPPLADDPSLAGKVLRSFNPDKAQLSTWTKRLVISDRPLNGYLQDHGIYLDSDWSLLNQLKAKRLHLLLTAHADVSETELQRAVAILESYHTVYRQDRLNHRDVLNRSRCEPPSLEQLERMVEHLKAKGWVKAEGWVEESINEEMILEQLQSWARLIRQARRPVTMPLDDPGVQKAIATLPTEGTQDELEAEELQQQFLQRYREALVTALDQAIAQVLKQRVAYLAKRNPPKDVAFLDGLHRFLCQGESMGAIAPHLGLKAQYQVSRLLNIKALRADIIRQAHVLLKPCIVDLAQNYVDILPVEPHLDDLLRGELERLLAEAEAESFTPHSPNRSLLNQRLCHPLTHSMPPL